MLNVQYHKFSITFTDRNSSIYTATHDTLLRDVIIIQKPKLLNAQSDIAIFKGKEERTGNTSAQNKAKTKVPIELCDGESLKLTKNKHNREKRSKQRHHRNKIRTKSPRGLAKVKDNYKLHVENSTRETRQIIKADILELHDIKPTTISDNAENDPYILNDIEPNDVSDAYSKKQLSSLVDTENQKTEVESSDIAPKKRKRTEEQNGIEDNFDVYYYTDQNHSVVFNATENNEDPAIIGTLLTETKANAYTRPMEATANIYYEDTSDCKQDTWQTIAWRHMQGIHTGRTRKTWRFNLKKQRLRTTDVALVQRLLRAYKEQNTEYFEHTLFQKNLQDTHVTTHSRRKSKVKIGDDGSLQYETNNANNNDDNVVEVTEIKEYETILGPVPPPEIEIHTMPVQTAITYYKYKDTGETPLPYTKNSPISTQTERVWVYTLKKYATRHYSTITNTYLLTKLKQHTSTTTKSTTVDKTSSEPSVFTYEKQTVTTKGTKSAQTVTKKKSAKGLKGSGNDWLYDVNDPDQVAYEMKVPEDDEENSGIRFHGQSMPRTDIQRRLSSEPTSDVIQSAVRNSAASSHPVRSWLDYLKKYAIYGTHGVIESNPNIKDNVHSVGATETEKETLSCEIIEEDDKLEGDIDFTIPRVVTHVMHLKGNDAKFTNRSMTLNQKFKCVYQRLIRT